MYERKVWVNRQSEHPSRRKLTPTGNDGEYDVSRSEGIIMEDGDAFDADTMNDLERRVAAGFTELDPTGAGGDEVTVQPYTCEKRNGVYELVGSGAVGRCKIPASWAAGDSFTVNGVAVPAYCGADAVDGDTIVKGRWVLFFYDGTQLNFNGGGGLSASKLALATATPDDVPNGLTFYTAGSKTLQSGKLPVQGDWSAEITPGGQVTVPPGRHSGSGKVTATHDRVGTITINFPYATYGGNQTASVDTGHKILGMVTGRIATMTRTIWTEEAGSQTSTVLTVDVSYSGSVITGTAYTGVITQGRSVSVTVSYMY